MVIWRSIPAATLRRIQFIPRQAPSRWRLPSIIKLGTPRTSVGPSEHFDIEPKPADSHLSFLHEASAHPLGDLAMTQIRGEVKQLQQMLGLLQSGHGPANVVFVCIDCEAYEHAQHKITEIGVSVLDSRTLSSVEPGTDGASWFALMKHLHIRPIEYAKLVNKRFIRGCPDKFNFGTSTFRPLKEAGPILTRIFCDPTQMAEACDLSIKIADIGPKIVLVGHDLKNDTDYLSRLGFSPKNVIARMDTQKLARWSKSDQPGLTRLLKVLDIDARNLHNAGNDAAYTLQCLVQFAVREHIEPGSVARLLAAEKSERLEAKAKLLAKKQTQTIAASSTQDGVTRPRTPPLPSAPARTRMVDQTNLPAMGTHPTSLSKDAQRPSADRKETPAHGSRHARKLRRRLQEQVRRSNA